MSTATWDRADERQFLASLSVAALRRYRALLVVRPLDFDGRSASSSWRASVLDLIDSRLRELTGPIRLVSDRDS